MKEMSYLEMNDVNGGDKLAIGCVINSVFGLFLPNPVSVAFGIFCIGYGIGELF
ncbi:hypothetical protein KAJ27_06400 [bacterium]|nr:hypothetical protein [Candidatus Neomarinimicrobiota bacterium]MCK5683730.1 hypothetical protein [bacterium]